MLGQRYWSTGITVRWQERNGWGAHLRFHDDGFMDNRSTEGSLHTRYFIGGSDGLAKAIDLLREDAERLGIEFRTAPVDPGPWIYYETDGEDSEWPPPPRWREQLAEQAQRLGWTSYDSLPTP
jgi:hypothetical protein